MPITSTAYNTWVASKKETSEAVSRLAAFVRACNKVGSQVTPEGLALAVTALEQAEEAMSNLEQFGVVQGIV